MSAILASQRRRRHLKLGAAYLCLSAAAGVVLFPYLWMLLTSFKPIEEFFSYPLQWFTRHWTLRQYQAVLQDPRFLASVKNSLLVSGAVTTISLGLSIPAAYGLTRLRTRGGNTVLVTIVSSQFFPPMIFFIPFYIILSRFRLLNTLTGLTFAYLSVTLPICTWMIANTFRAVPRELEEAARVDGCGDLRTIVEILLRICTPGIITAGLFAFVLAWQEYIFALLYTTTSAAQTAPVILFYFLGQHQIDYGRLMAGAVLLSLPIVIPFAALQRYFRQGRMEGGVKG